MAAKITKYVKDPNFSYADNFDRLMEEHFGEKFKTEWNLFQGSYGGYQTRRVNGKKTTKRMFEVGRTISNAMVAGEMEYVRA